jgi:hypothetical protein
MYTYWYGGLEKLGAGNIPLHLPSPSLDMTYDRWMHDESAFILSVRHDGRGGSTVAYGDNGTCMN